MGRYLDGHCQPKTAEIQVSETGELVSRSPQLTALLQGEILTMLRVDQALLNKAYISNSDGTMLRQFSFDIGACSFASQRGQVVVLEDGSIAIFCNNSGFLGNRDFILHLDTFGNVLGKSASVTNDKSLFLQSFSMTTLTTNGFYGQLGECI